ncbi:hypothetical protein BOTBODRAFT_30368 [Botryobasidium botryosum FD-172 SS1]|uniref:BAG domain-containing protein n=1 Tax=Botryobasidium botryosum (strain FD-172 SS1) TaxID=930990 RepID=A0A067MN70_BOTB1|nr:hypothetical protein BOTBODRAFT_30368 [Botryobasidium botryosum FD-172 SS1]
MLFMHPSYDNAPFSPYSVYNPSRASEQEDYYRALAEEHERHAMAARARQEQEALRRAAALQRQRQRSPAYYPSYHHPLFSPRQSEAPLFASSRYPQQTVRPQQDERVRAALAEKKRRVREEELRRQAASESRQRQLWDTLYGRDDEVEPKGEKQPESKSISISISTPGDSQPHTDPKPTAASQSTHAAASTIQSHWRAYIARTRALRSLSRLENEFGDYRAAFVFPSSIDFAPDASVPKLLYTTNNKPVHAYEHQLTSLLTKIDEVESAGAKNVREARKALVRKIEAELESLDERKKQAWEAQNKPTVQSVDEVDYDVAASSSQQDIPMAEDTSPIHALSSQEVPAQPASIADAEANLMEDVQEANAVDDSIELEEADASAQSGVPAPEPSDPLSAALPASGASTPTTSPSRDDIDTPHLTADTKAVLPVDSVLDIDMDASPTAYGGLTPPAPDEGSADDTRTIPTHGSLVLPQAEPILPPSPSHSSTFLSEPEPLEQGPSAHPASVKNPDAMEIYMVYVGYIVP